jgi:hypothetical protein
MVRQTVIWTALPNGFRKNRLHLSVFVSPRLRPDTASTTLDRFDFHNWSRKNIELKVQFGNNPTIRARRIGQQPDPGLWNVLFKDDTLVERYNFVRAGPIVAYPISSIRDHVQATYAGVAVESPTKLAPVETLANDKFLGLLDFKSNKEAIEKGEKLKADIKQIFINKAKAVQGKSYRDTKTLMAKKIKKEPDSTSPSVQKQRNYLQAEMVIAPKATLREIELPRMDFHKMVSSIGQYPEILRRLGLIIDLEIPISPNNVPPSGLVRVIPSYEHPSNVNVIPRTKYKINTYGFMAHPRVSKFENQRPVYEIQNGMLLLNSEDYDVIQFDEQNAVMNILHLAARIMEILRRLRLVTGTPQDSSAGREPPGEHGIPPIRGGFAVIRKDRAELLQEMNSLQEAANTAINSAVSSIENSNQTSTIADVPEVELEAEEILRGYRIDVWDSKTKEWHSLCKRVGKYTIGSDFTLSNLQDEGFVSTALTNISGDIDSGYSTSEAIFRWDGWSLCAPRPGKVIAPDDNVMSQQELKDRDRLTAMNATGFRLETDFIAAPHSLPKLRFGVDYRFRVRVVDLAGNSVPFDSPVPDDFATSTRPITYSRFEPVSSPIMVLRHHPKEGESLEHLVIRSNYNKSTSEYNIPAENRTAERHVAPRKTSQLMAEEHGMFDDPSAIDTEGKSIYQLIKEKDRGEYAEIESVEQLDMRYMPDPLSLGALFRDLPTSDGLQENQIHFYQNGAKWPNARPFLLRVEEGRIIEWNWNDKERLLSIKLPKAEVVTLRLSSFIAEQDLAIMGMWRWTDEEKKKPINISKGQTPEELKTLSMNGKHVMLTPYRKITLVHAVQQPLIEPAFENPEVQKLQGWTYVFFKDKIKVSRKSTAKLDILAEWNEPIDDLNEPKWKSISNSTPAFEVPIREREGEDFIELSYPITPNQTGYRHEFGDTKYREVVYHIRATTRFLDYIPKDPSQITKLVKQDLKDKIILDHIPKDPSQITDDPNIVTRDSTPVTLKILSSARPASPKVLYIIPTFKWEKVSRDSGIEKRRIGGGLRVYMERPWFSSGDGELLGVVLYDPTDTPIVAVPQSVPITPLPTPGTTPFIPEPSLATEIPEEYKSFVTQWGVDPIWRSEPTHPIPLLRHFKNKVTQQKNLALDELPLDKTVAVAGHTVEYDEERKLWYCDIEMDAGASYWPFVRLALARYQPNSIGTTTLRRIEAVIVNKGVHLSRVVLADFVQLAPDRYAGYSFVDSKNLHVWVGGTKYISSEVGSMYGQGETEGGTEVEVSVESKQRDEGELDWKPVETFKLQKPSPNIRVPSSESALWTVQITLPEKLESESIRLVFKEYEVFYSDLVPDARQKYKRLVYADVLEI